MGGANSVPSTARFISAKLLQPCIVGRYSTVQEQIIYDWGGTSLTFQIQGSSYCYLEFNGGKGYYNLAITQDGKTITKVVSTSNKVKKVLLTDTLLLESIVTFQLTKRNEPTSGLLITTYHCTKFSGIHIDQKAHHINQVEEKTNRQRRHIEFIGDSDTAGFGNLGKATSINSILSGGPSKQDTSQAWPAFVAHEFDADYSNISYSGIGAHFNFPIPGFIKETMYDLYPRLVCTDKTTDCIENDNVEVLPKVDIVVIYLGGNDWYNFNDQKKKNQSILEAEFVEGFTKFLNRVQDIRSNIPILVLHCDKNSGSCCSTIENQEKYSKDMLRTLSQACASVSENKHIYFETVDCSQNKIQLKDKLDWGSMEHWSVKGHQKFSDGCIPLIEKIMSWERTRNSKTEEGKVASTKSSKM